ncbi:MAG: aspartate/glutamate racemase family protein [Eubacteriales bacterium]
MNDRIIGIIGGMGPEATADFYQRFVNSTKVEKDQEHFHVVIDSNPKIPDRTKAILCGEKNPLPEIIKTAKNLEKIGVEIACIPCLTSHYYIKEIQESVNYKIINILKELNTYIINNYKHIKKVGILATSGTVEMKLFNQHLREVEIIYPDKKIQEEKVMEAIYGKKGIKRGNLKNEPVRHLIEASENLKNNGAEAIIFGCTEIGLALKQKHVSLQIIDPLDVAIKELIK